MSDLIFLGLFAAMMTAAYVYISVCDRIVGPPESDEAAR